MPIFEYKCSKCGNVFEELVPQTVEQPLPCPKCKSGETEKIMSVCGAHMGSAGSSAMPSCGASGGCSSPQGCPSGGCCPKFN